MLLALSVSIRTDTPLLHSMLSLFDLHDCAVIGGDTTIRPLNIFIITFRETQTAQALRRDTAKIGDDIWVSGTLGDARLALDALYKKIVLDNEQLASAAQRLHMPQPRVALSLALRGIDRKSVVQGKSVSVRVDHGGRRIIKKKKKKKTNKIES